MCWCCSAALFELQLRLLSLCDYPTPAELCLLPLSASVSFWWLSLHLSARTLCFFLLLDLCRIAHMNEYPCQCPKTLG